MAICAQDSFEVAGVFVTGVFPLTFVSSGVVGALVAPQVVSVWDDSAPQADVDGVSGSVGQAGVAGESSADASGAESAAGVVSQVAGGAGVEEVEGTCGLA